MSAVRRPVAEVVMEAAVWAAEETVGGWVAVATVAEPRVVEAMVEGAREAVEKG